MTIILHVGRRTSKQWFRRQYNAAVGMVTFQENLWLMVKQAIYNAKKKANEAASRDEEHKGIIFNIIPKEENESLNTKIEWLKIVIQGSEAQEDDEYKDIQNFYKPFGKLFKRSTTEMTVTDKANFFKSSVLNAAQVEDAYKKGYGSVNDKNISNKMLEMGILLAVDYRRDFNDSERSQNLLI